MLTVDSDGTRFGAVSLCCRSSTEPESRNGDRAKNRGGDSEYYRSKGLHKEPTCQKTNDARGTTHARSRAVDGPLIPLVDRLGERREE